MPEPTTPLPTRDLIGVEILSVGGPFKGIGSPPEGDFYTEEDLRKFVEDTNAVIDEIKPFNKLGHSAAQILARRSGLWDDDKPQTGRLTNLRVEGGKILTDLRAVPAKLADLIESGAFPERSVEVKPYESQTGKGRFSKVIRALSWQGAKAPAIKTLDDVVALYGDDEPEDDPELQIVTWRVDGEAPTLDLQIDLVPGERKMTGDADTRVVPDGNEKTPALALDEDQAKKIAEILGVEGDLTADVLLEKAQEVKTLAERSESGGEGEGNGEGEGEGSGDGNGEGEAEGTGSGEGSGEGTGAESGARMMSEADYNDLLARANAGAAAAKKLAEKERDELIYEAIKDGRLDPAQREEFVRLYEESADFTTRVLKTLPENPERAEIFGSEAEREFTEEDSHLYDRYVKFASIDSIPVDGEAA